MKCIECGAELKVTVRKNYRDPLIGLPGVVLKNVQVWDCPKCGEGGVVFERMTAMLRLLAETVINKRGHFTGDEIRFLRKHLGFSSGDFAKRMGVTLTQVSRWEHGKSAISPTADRLLRLLVAYTEPVKDYSAETLLAVDAKPAARGKVVLELHKKTWRLATAG